MFYTIMKAFPIDWLHIWNRQLKKHDKKVELLPEPHPAVSLCCKYFKCLQLLQVAELDTGLEVYYWSSRMQ